MFLEIANSVPVAGVPPDIVRQQYKYMIIKILYTIFNCRVAVAQCLVGHQPREQLIKIIVSVFFI
jgi:hypothetical protein